MLRAWFGLVNGAARDRLDTIGEGASQMGYGGIENSIAIEFDTWYNPDLGDLFSDHISVRSRTPSSCDITHSNVDALE